jgi:hypothetical protein
MAEDEEGRKDRRKGKLGESLKLKYRTMTWDIV